MPLYRVLVTLLYSPESPSTDADRTLTLTARPPTSAGVDADITLLSLTTIERYMVGEPQVFTNENRTISIVTPAFNEALNIRMMYEEICDALDGEEWEWTVVDDHSKDDTFESISALDDARVRCIRLSRNFGSHAAATCGILNARGGCAVLMAADLQDPPSIIPELLTAWRRDADVVWAVRATTEGRTISRKFASGLYHSWLGRMPGLDRFPFEGSDFVLLDRKVIVALKSVPERNTSIFGLIAWLGFKHGYVPYTKRARSFGISGWTFGRRVKLTFDSVIAFSHLPMRLIMWLGFGVATLGIAYAVFVLIGGIRGASVPGWSSTMVAVTVLGGVQMIMIGVIGQYLWRVLDEVRRRPLYVVEKVSQTPASGRDTD